MYLFVTWNVSLKIVDLTRTESEEKILLLVFELIVKER